MIAAAVRLCHKPAGRLCCPPESMVSIGLTNNRNGLRAVAMLRYRPAQSEFRDRVFSIFWNRQWLRNRAGNRLLPRGCKHHWIVIFAQRCNDLPWDPWRRRKPHRTAAAGLISGNHANHPASWAAVRLPPASPLIPLAVQ